MGWGLRAREDVKKGALIIEYVGEIISEDQMRVINFYFFVIFLKLLIILIIFIS